MKILLLIFLALISTAVQSTEHKGPSFEKKGQDLYFRGKIDRDSSASVINAISKGVRRLFITSGGGDAAAALSIAETIASNKVEVIVKDYCFSSCANYIFLSGARKSLSANSILGFHGGFHKTFSPSELSNLSSEIVKLIDEDSRFFDKLQINRRLFQLSHELTKPKETKEIYIVKDNERENRFQDLNEALVYFEREKLKRPSLEVSFSLLGISEDVVYFPNLENLKTLGVRNISKYYYPKNKYDAEELKRKMSVDIIFDKPFK